MKIGQLVVLVDEVDGLEAGRERRLHHGCTRRHAHGRLPNVRTLAPGPGAHLAGSPSGALPSFEREGRKGTVMSEENVDARPLTSVELLDAAVWREIGSEEAQPAAAFLEALSRLVGRWLMVRSDAPEMDVVTVLCKARGYIARQEVRQTTNEIEWRR